MSGHPRRRPAAYGLEIASILRESIARRQMLQREVSDHTGISRSQISLYLKGVKSPTVDEFIDICHAIDALPHKVMVQATYTVHWRKARGIEDEHVKPDDTELRVLAWGDGPATP